uniref:Integrase, catalytic region, zinc finger, CCHC-type, peptidase aspartic, catalytic n=1 Tax=Tanacetum cinerariifolium TaxID=118510 RepID=A0A6L2KS22_TANCI|nr:hypothetical protein [Tanacetum cinerariifolium]
MMSTNDKESSAAGMDNRPPMLEKSDFDSWKIRIERYICGKPLRKIIWKSIENGPTPHPMITVTTEEGVQQTQVTREKTDEELTEAENNKERTDIHATNILNQGLPRHIFNTLNQTKTAKEILENVELLMQRFSLTEQQHKETLFDQYERFWANGNESIHDYFIRFYKLINDMKITKMEISVHQRNTKFVNNLPSNWGQSYKQHAMKTLSKMNQTFGNADPLAYMAQASQSSSYTPSQYVPPPPQFQKQFPPTNNQLRTSTNLMTQATIQADKALLMEAKEKGTVLDAKAEAFLADMEYTVSYAEPLAITTTATFDDLRSQLAGHFKVYEEQSFANDSLKAELERYKTQVQNLKQSIEDNIFKEVSEYVKIFDELEKEYDQCVIDKKSLEIENKNLLIQNECLIAKSVSKDICSIVLTSDIPVPISAKPRNLELEAEILKMKQLIVCNNSSSPELDVFFQIDKLRDHFQGKDDLIRKLKAQINNMKEVSAGPNLSTLEYQALETKNTQLKDELTAVRIKNDSLMYENVSIKKRYQDLYKSKAEINSNVSSGAAVRVKPKVLALGLYAMTPNVGSKWKPTGRKFTLDDTCPLTRITKPEVVPLEKSRSVSTSEPAINVTMTPRCSTRTVIIDPHGIGAEGDLKKFSDIGAWVYVPRCMTWLEYGEHVDSLSTMDNEVGVISPESTTQTLSLFEEYISPMTYLKEVEKTLGPPIEEVPSFDEPEPQSLLNSSSLDASLGDVIGPEPPIKPYSPNSSRMKVVDYLTTQTPPSTHVANSHPKGVYSYYNPGIDEPKRHYGFKPGLLGKSVSLGVDISNWEMFNDDWGLESKEVSPLG